eukprot:scaffold99386_cov75-Phaeocystis_antarctica.AAC.3
MAAMGETPSATVRSRSVSKLNYAMDPMLVDDAQYSIFPTEAEMLGKTIAAPVRRSSSCAAMHRTNEVNLHRMKTLSSLPESMLGLHRELAYEPEPSTAGGGALLGASSDGELRVACRQRSLAGSGGRRRGSSRSGRDGVQTVELREEDEEVVLDAAPRGRGQIGAAPPRPLQLPPPGATSVRFRSGGASLSPEQRVRSEKLRAAVWRRWDEEAPEATVLAPIRAHARSGAGQPSASGLSTWAQRHEVLATDEALRASAPLSFEEEMALELQGLDLRASSAGWKRAVGEKQLDDFESRHRAAARRGLRLLGTGRLGRVGPSGGGDLLLPTTLAQSEFEAALDALRHNRIHAGTSRARAQPRILDPRNPEPYERYTTEVPTRARGHLSLSEISLVD